MRARVWTFILYPESMPEKWKEFVESENFMVPLVLSPLHDKDLQEDSDPEKNPYHPYKKPHYHCMVSFTNVKSYKQVQEMAKPLGGPKMVSQVHSTQAMIRYFIHADHKNKQPYNKEDIQSFNGADPDQMFIKNDKEVYMVIGDMMDFISNNTITEFSDFMDHVRKEQMAEWMPIIASGHQWIIMKYIESNRYKINGK